MNLSGLNCTIIGCGWLGLPLGRSLFAEGAKVFGATRSLEKFDLLKEYNISPFQLGNNSKPQISTEILEKTDILIISLPPTDRKNPTNYADYLEQLILQFPKQTQIIFTSSTGVYPKNAGIYSEDFVFDNMVQPSALLAAENRIQSCSPQSIILRLGGLFGPNRHPIGHIQGRKSMPNPLGQINFVHLEDIIRAVHLLINQSQATGIFNLVYPDHPAKSDYYLAAAKHFDLSPPEFNEGPSVSRIVLSNRIQSQLGFQFKFDLYQF